MELKLYGIEGAEDHSGCRIADFCRNPLHPGPCKGWKGTLRAVAPGIHKATEETRLKRVRERREARAKAAADEGKKAPRLRKLKHEKPFRPQRDPKRGSKAYHVAALRAHGSATKDIADALQANHIDEKTAGQRLQARLSTQPLKVKPEIEREAIGELIQSLLDAPDRGTKPRPPKGSSDATEDKGGKGDGGPIDGDGDGKLNEGAYIRKIRDALAGKDDAAVMKSAEWMSYADIRAMEPGLLESLRTRLKAVLSDKSMERGHLDNQSAARRILTSLVNANPPKRERKDWTKPDPKDDPPADRDMSVEAMVKRNAKVFRKIKVDRANGAHGYFETGELLGRDEEELRRQGYFTDTGGGILMLTDKGRAVVAALQKPAEEQKPDTKGLTPTQRRAAALERWKSGDREGWTDKELSEALEAAQSGKMDMEAAEGIAAALLAHRRDTAKLRPGVQAGLDALGAADREGKSSWLSSLQKRDITALVKGGYAEKTDGGGYRITNDGRRRLGMPEKAETEKPKPVREPIKATGPTQRAFLARHSEAGAEGRPASGFTAKTREWAIGLGLVEQRGDRLYITPYGEESHEASLPRRNGEVIGWDGKTDTEREADREIERTRDTAAAKEAARAELERGLPPTDGGDAMGGRDMMRVHDASRKVGKALQADLGLKLDDFSEDISPAARAWSNAARDAETQGYRWHQAHARERFLRAAAEADPDNAEGYTALAEDALTLAKEIEDGQDLALERSEAARVALGETILARYKAAGRRKTLAGLKLPVQVKENIVGELGDTRTRLVREVVDETAEAIRGLEDDQMTTKARTDYTRAALGLVKAQLDVVRLRRENTARDSDQTAEASAQRAKVSAGNARVAAAQDTLRRTRGIFEDTVTNRRRELGEEKPAEEEKPPADPAATRLSIAEHARPLIRELSTNTGTGGGPRATQSSKAADLVAALERGDAVRAMLTARTLAAGIPAGTPARARADAVLERIRRLITGQDDLPPEDEGAPPPFGGSRGQAGTGKDLSGQVIADFQALQPADPKDFFLTGENRWSEANAGSFGNPGDQVLTELAKAQGWGLPEVGTAADVDARVAQGWLEGFRGVRDSKYGTAAGQIEAMRDDPDFALGTGIYGNGVYFSANQGVADSFAARDPDVIGMKPVDGAVARVAVNPAAKMIDYDAAVKAQNAWLAANPPIPGVEMVVYDVGRWAAMMGYDVIRVTGLQDGTFYKNAKGSKIRSKADQYVVLNRGAMIQEKGEPA